MVRNTIIFGLILILLGGFYYFYEYKGAPKREAVKKASEKLLACDKDAVNKLNLNTPSLKLSFDKANDLWNLVQPLKAEANSGDLESFISQITGLNKDQVIEDSDNSWQEYGLKTPAYKVELITPKATYSLWIGDKNPMGDSYYARLNQGKVFMISSSLSSYLEKPLEGFRQKDAMDFSADDLEQLSLIYPKEILTALKEGDKWKLTASGKTEKADAEILKSYCWGIKDIKATGFLTSVPKGNPILTLEVKLKSSPLAQSLKIYALDVNAKAYPALRTKYGEVLLLPQEAAQKLFKTYPDFMDKHILALKDEDLTEMELKFENRKLVAGKEKDSWKVEEPKFKDNKNYAIYSNISKLKDLKYESKFNSQDLKSLGLDQSFRTISFYGKDKKLLVKLLIGSKDKDFQNLKLDNAPEIYRVKLGDWNTLENDINNLLNSPLKK
jgi:hypothetical protein